MNLQVIGMEADEAQRLLTDAGFAVRREQTASPRGVNGADSARVIRVRELGNNNIEITVAHFKIRV